MAAGDRAKVKDEARALRRDADQSRVIADGHELRAQAITRQLEKLEAEIASKQRQVPDEGWVNHYRSEIRPAQERADELRAKVKSEKESLDVDYEMKTTFPRTGDDEEGWRRYNHYKKLYEEDVERLKAADEEVERRKDTYERAKKEHDDFEDLKQERTDLIAERQRELDTAKGLDAAADFEYNAADAIDKLSEHVEASVSDFVNVDLLGDLDVDVEGRLAELDRIDVAPAVEDMPASTLAITETRELQDYEVESIQTEERVEDVEIEVEIEIDEPVDDVAVD